MSVISRLIRELANPTHLPWQRRPRVGDEGAPCMPQPPRDPKPVRPPDPECTTGPDPRNVKRIFKR